MYRGSVCRDMVRFILVTMLIAFSAMPPCARADHIPPPVEATSDRPALNTDLEVYKDGSGSQTIESVLSQSFQPVKREVPNFGFSQAVYWFKLTADNPTPVPLTRYLQVANNFLDFVGIYVRKDPSQSLAHYQAGSCVPYDKRLAGLGGPVLHLHLSPEEKKTIFVRVQSRTPIRVPIFLLSEAAYHRTQLENIFVLGLFCGVLGFLIIYNLFAWTILKQRAYIYYILLLACICIHQLAWANLVPRVTLFGHPETMQHLFISAYGLVCMLSILFVMSFMDDRRKFPVSYRILDILLIGSVALFLLFLFDFYIGNYVSYWYTQLLAWTLVAILGFMWYKGETHARYVFLAHLPFPLLGAVVVGFLIGVLPYRPLFEQAIKLGCIVQGIFLSLALADKFATLQKDFQHILERTVAKRSAELVSANLVLKKEISQRKRTEEELRQAKEAAEATTRAKGDFLANMSHEIRTPLNAVLGMMDLMLDSPLSDQQRDRAEVVMAATDALYSLLSDILDFSKIEAGKLDLAETTFSVRNVLAKTEALLAVKAQDKALHLNWSVSESVPARLRGDPNRLRQILLNLGNNAIKFTDQGEISVHVDVEEQKGDEVTLHFCVQDTGIGISEDKLGSVFDRFTQADSSTKRKYGGTGLGLAISSQLAAAMGGEMWVESEEGKGSTFHFRVRFRMGEEPQTFDPTSTQEIVAAIDLRGMKVLLAEDNIFNQAVALEVLGKQGCEVTIASNGKEAVEAFAAKPFDIVLMDLQMPEMDGIEAARAIRAQETSGRVPIIALTAHAFIDYRERCLEAGMDEHLSKPIRVSELLTVLARFTSSYKARSQMKERPAETAQSGHAQQKAAPAIDHQALLERLGGDEQALREMVDLFCAHIPGLVQDIRNAAQGENWKQLAKLCHTLAGACATFGASALADVARQIERNAAPPRSVGLEELLSHMELELLALERYVEKLRS